MAKKKEKMLKITQIRSIIGQKPDHKRTMAALGLRKIRQTVVQKDNPQTWGMINKVKHLVDIEEVK